LFCFICIKTTYTHKHKEEKHTHKGFNQTIQTQKKNDYEAAVDDGGEGVLSFVIVDDKLCPCLSNNARSIAVKSIGLVVEFV